MNMDEYFVLFREYMLVQKPSSVNTRDSYLRDVSAFLRYLEGENITSPLEVETETVLQDLTRIMDQVLMENIRRQQQVSRTVETQ